MKVSCNICPHKCMIEEGRVGFCQARKNFNGKIICENYGKITSIALDPIEKKPLKHFFPGSKILSVGSFGCNLRCPFCQNYRISMAGENEIEYISLSPKQLVEKALHLKGEGNIGIAYTYNEPLIGYEFVYDCALLVAKSGMKNVIVSNGYICEKPLLEILPYIDAMNIDLKGFTEEFYKKLGGNLQTVKNTIKVAASRCHVEITTLIIPGENDSKEEIEKLSKWISDIREDIPLHITKFHPEYKYLGKEPTPVKTVYDLAKIARKNLQYVHEGNC